MRLCWRKSTKNLPHVHELSYDQWTITELASVCMRHTFPQAQSAKTCPACLDCYKRSSMSLHHASGVEPSRLVAPDT